MRQEDTNDLAADSRLPALGNALHFDVEQYRKYFEDSGLSDAQQREMLEALWILVVGFVDMGFGLHPVQHVLDGREKMLATDSTPGLESSRTRKKQQNKAAKAFARAAGKRDS